MALGCSERQQASDEAATVSGQATARIDEQEAGAIEIYASADWYRARPEPEQTWQGLLQKRDVVAGPASRSALLYTLVTEGDQFPVYAANVERLLDPFAGRRVSVRGKLVDLSEEGYGLELWIATIEGVETQD